MAVTKAKANYITADTIDVTDPGTFTGTYTPSTYTSEYSDQISSAMNDLVNWSYDPLQDASYQALSKVYAKKGEIAAKNSLADAASLNGGYGTSYAVSAAQQARNQYNQELASYIPDLEANAYTKAANKLTYLQNADDTAYARYRDSENDKYNQYLQEYQQYRDSVSDYQYGLNYNQNATQYAQSYNQDAYQFKKQFNLDLQNSKKAKASTKTKTSSGGGTGYVSTATGNSDISKYYYGNSNSSGTDWRETYGKTVKSRQNTTQTSTSAKLTKAQRQKNAVANDPKLSRQKSNKK